ncbi:MAG: alkaline phosphatase family protein [Anaerolineales bacterium]|nr:MAG: alkaline phosphatase family protein [Anaerolineales bacterium]
MRFWILILAAFFLTGCGLPASTPTVEVAPVLPTPTLTSEPLPVPATEAPLPTSTPEPLPKVERVLIVSFDGLRPDAIEDANMETVLSLMENGAYTLSAQTISPSLTLPAHASMLVGTCPAKHIVRWNLYVPQNGYALGTDIFDLARAVDLRTVMVVAKEKLRQVTEPTSTDYFAFIDKTDRIEDFSTVLRLALNQINEGFGLMFVHFGEGDIEGHASGWMTRAQLGVYGREDRGLGSMIQTLKDKGLYETTLIIVTSDHGGHDSTHGTDLPEDMTIPWVISGPGIVPGELQTQVHTMDTAATAAFALGLPIPPDWDGIPVYEAFGMPVDLTRDGGCPVVTK